VLNVLAVVMIQVRPPSSVDRMCCPCSATVAAAEGNTSDPQPRPVDSMCCPWLPLSLWIGCVALESMDRMCYLAQRQWMPPLWMCGHGTCHMCEYDMPQCVRSRVQMRHASMCHVTCVTESVISVAVSVIGRVALAQRQRLPHL